MKTKTNRNFIGLRSSGILLLVLPAVGQAQFTCAICGGTVTITGCANLTGVFLYGDAPGNVGSLVFFLDYNATVYCLPGTTGWATTFAERPTALWLPQMQGARTSFGVSANQFGFTIDRASGKTVVEKACTDLFNPAWQAVQTNALTTGSADFSDPDWTNCPGRYNRVRSP